jgi:hypothetical protein
MARCPACFRRVKLINLISQARLPVYTCARCGREWNFSRWSIAIAIAVVLAPLIYAGLHLDANWANDLPTIVSAIALAIAGCFAALLVFGQLRPVRNRRRKSVPIRKDR